MREQQEHVWYQGLWIMKTRKSPDIYQCLEFSTYISTLSHTHFFPFAFYFFPHPFYCYFFHPLAPYSFLFLLHCFLPHTQFWFHLLSFALFSSLPLSFHHLLFLDPLLLFSLPVSWHYITLLLLMRVRVRLWLHRWNDIMSHNLSFISQRARAGRRRTHQSLLRHMEQFNNLL